MLQRRDILRSCLRGGGLLALGGVAALLGTRTLSGSCLRTNPCGGCPLFTGCELPKAKDSKTGGALAPRAHAKAPPMNRPRPVFQSWLGLLSIPCFNLRPQRGRTTFAASARPRHLAGNDRPT